MYDMLPDEIIMEMDPPYPEEDFSFTPKYPSVDATTKTYSEPAACMPQFGVRVEQHETETQQPQAGLPYTSIQLPKSRPERQRISKRQLEKQVASLKAYNNFLKAKSSYLDASIKYLTQAV
ncbi:hypothetical protein H2198_003363 [Neophaeococcomyces mojaviensis]|uniref:Uncharacterized protein n=1 Tax=Neophaeococcomyces mojaviensis TaxID=3383035 RepID=A0ACC3ABN3_9EURO|nr:hypothetical protein H2198_003363 [Knufia sp. JES_112]